MAYSSRRIFPHSIEAEIQRLPWRGLGLAIATLSALSYLSLATWSNADPSLNHATDQTARNILGPWGAMVADLLMQTAGLASVVLLWPPLVWGLAVIRGEIPERLKLKILYTFLATVLTAGALSAAKTPSGWPLENGLGGVTGDLFGAFFVRLGGFIEPALASLIGAALASAGAAWAIMRALDLSTAAARPVPRPGYVTPEPVPEPVSYPRVSRMTTRMAAWRERLLPVLINAVATKPRPGPREYWMTPRPISALAETTERMGDRLAASIVQDFNTRTNFRAQRPEPGFEPRATIDRRIEPFFGPDALSFDRLPEDEYATTADGSRSQSPYEISRSPQKEPAQPGHGFARSHASGMADDDDPDDTFSRPAPEPDAFALPSIRLLAEPPKNRTGSGLTDEELREKANALEEVLDDFGVKGKVTRVYPGPVITLYELEPARGTKSSRVIGLADDIARSMSAVSARVAVIPGRDALGIELPNETPETVYLRDLFASEGFTKTQAKLPLALGKTISGQPMIAELAKMPHLLIAGTTGSGKSVGINAMILSLLFRLTPAEARFIMIDPKMLELSVYDGIPHLLAPVVTDPKKAIAALKWTVNEMNIRYEKMCKLGVRNLSGYNQKVLHAQLSQRPLRRTVNTGFDELSGAAVYESEDIPAEPLPYIIVVIDEMADLMMAAGKDIEYCVQRLSQMARAAGIHVIMATQRPSVDVVTGTIKANFPSRISYQVMSKIDSRTILGEQGAEQLLGQGDMLYMQAGGRISRAHGPFVSEDDVEKVVRYLKSQGAPDYLHSVTEAMDVDGEDGGAGKAKGGDSGDQLYDEAVAIVLADRRPTTSYLQRRLGVGYNRAASLIERMEQDGIVSAPNRTGKREVLLPEA